MARFMRRDISSTLPFVRITEHTADSSDETAALPDEAVGVGENDLATSSPSENPTIASPESDTATPSACSAAGSQTPTMAGSLPSSCVVVEEDPQSSCQRRHRRAHHHRSSSRRHHRACRIKWKDVNFMALMSSVVAAVLVCTSLAESHWWYVTGGWCRDLQYPITYLGVRTFFFNGHFENVLQDGRPSSIYYYGATSNTVLIDCLSLKTVRLIQVIVALCFLVIVFNVSAILIELITFTNCFMKVLRRTAIFSILSVCICVTINGLSYLVTQQLSEYYEANPFRPDSKIDVEFSLSFYTIMASGIMSIFAVAFALLCRRNSRSSGSATSSRWSPSVTTGRLVGHRRCHDDRLIDADFNQLDRSGNCESLPALPPPYSP